MLMLWADWMIHIARDYSSVILDITVQEDQRVSHQERVHESDQ